MKTIRKNAIFAIVAKAYRDFINSAEFLNKARKRPQDFTRNRKMPFPKLIAFMLNTIKGSIQTSLDRFYETIGQDHIHMTQQSFSEAREKINWEALRDFSQVARDIVYDHDHKTWHGYRVSAIDGTKLQLPADIGIKDHFGTAGRGSTSPAGQASALYDVYNNMLLDVRLEPSKTSERALADLHIEALINMPSFKKELLLLDRGYASFELIEKLMGHGISFVMRVKRRFNILIDRLPEGDHIITLRKKGHPDIKVRVIKFTLPSGEEETLITDIKDKRMGIEAFKTLYFKRWPIETKYDEIKNKLEVENFSGRTVNAVLQDFYISMYLSNLIAIAAMDAQNDIDEKRKDKDNKYSYHVNINHAIGVFKDRFIVVLLDENPRRRDKNFQRIMYLLKEHVVPTRPDRSVPRNPNPRKSKFHHNKKSNC